MEKEEKEKKEGKEKGAITVRKRYSSKEESGWPEIIGKGNFLQNAGGRGKASTKSIAQAVEFYTCEKKSPKTESGVRPEGTERTKKKKRCAKIRPAGKRK